MNVKQFLRDFVESLYLVFVSGIREWQYSKQIEGLNDIENQLFLHYLTRYSPLYIFMESRKLNTPKDNFHYGELPYEVSCEFSKIVNIKEHDVVYDLGCGRGKFLFFINQLIKCRCIGIDLLPTYIKIANKIVEKLNLKRIEFFQEDIVKVNLQTASVALIHGTTFSKETHDVIMRNVIMMKPGSRFISVTVPYEHSRLELITKKKFLVSWGKATVYFYYLNK